MFNWYEEYDDWLTCRTKYLFSIREPLANSFSCDGRHAKYNLHIELSHRYSLTFSIGYLSLFSSNREMPVLTRRKSASFLDLKGTDNVIKTQNYWMLMDKMVYLVLKGLNQPEMMLSSAGMHTDTFSRCDGSICEMFVASLLMRNRDNLAAKTVRLVQERSWVSVIERHIHIHAYQFIAKTLESPFNPILENSSSWFTYSLVMRRLNFRRYKSNSSSHSNLNSVWF